MRLRGASCARAKGEVTQVVRNYSGRAWPNTSQHAVQRALGARRINARPSRGARVGRTVRDAAFVSSGQHLGPVVRWLARLSVKAALLVAAVLCAAPVPPAHADGPGSGPPWVVSVGDSYISGEAGRWAGNNKTFSSSAFIDALGATAYDDNSTGTGERIQGCHRSRSAEVYIGGGVLGENLACSGAKTESFCDTAHHVFKPGLDFNSEDCEGNTYEGQALMLQHFAAAHDIKLVAISIGGNDFGFGAVVEECAKDFVAQWVGGSPCSHDTKLRDRLLGEFDLVAHRVEQAVLHVGEAMSQAGYSSSQYSIIVQTYPSPLPSGTEFRYGEGYWNGILKVAARSTTRTPISPTALYFRLSMSR
jgi:hypothetical protein